MTAEAPVLPPSSSGDPRRTLVEAIRGATGKTWLVFGTTSVLIYLIIGPLAALIFSSFRKTEASLPFESRSPWSLENYQEVFFSSGTYSVLGNTFTYAVGALVVSFSISIALAWLVERTDMPFRNTTFTLIIAALGIPAVISAISWGLLLSPRAGVLNVFVRSLFGVDGEGPISVFSMPGLIFVQGITMVPVTFLLITGAFRAMDAVLEEAGAVSGSPFSTTVRRITLPVLAPALLAALVYQLVTVVESFDVPLVLGLRANIRVLSTEIFLQVRPPGGLPDYGVAATYSILLLALAVGPLLYYNRIIARSERFSTVSGKDYRRKRYELGRFKPLVLAGVGLYIFVSLVLPLLILVWTSLQPFYAVPSIDALSRVTTDAYQNLMNSPFFGRAVGNTLLLGTATAIATMVLGSLTSWIIVRFRSRWARALDVLAYLPHAFPGVIIGLSILLIYLLLPIPIVGTIWIIILALSTQFISLSTRLMSSSIAQIQQELEEAAEVSGARQGQVLRRILLPLVFPPFINGLLLIFLMAIKNLTLALILFSPNSIVMSTLIYQRWNNGQTEETAALGVIMVAITLVLSIGLRRASAVGSVR